MNAAEHTLQPYSCAFRLNLLEATDKGRLFVDFIYGGMQCRESLHLSDNRENRIIARQLLKRLDAELALGTFDYAVTFPRSRKAGKFGADNRIETFGEFARKWLELRRPSLKPATYHDYTSYFLLTFCHRIW